MINLLYFKPDMDDWRLTGQEDWLKGVKLLFKPYQRYSATWDHDHCEFCYAKFSLRPGDLSEGYTTEDQYRWICSPCFNDFRESFGWIIVTETTEGSGC